MSSDLLSFIDKEKVSLIKEAKEKFEGKFDILEV